jgi:transcriptional regulator with XRE-family HTH domain
MTRAPKGLDIDEVKRRLVQVRAELAISQRTAAELAGISKSVLEKHESHANDRIPNTRQLFLLAETYGVSTDWLLGRTRVSEVVKG